MDIYQAEALADNDYKKKAIQFLFIYSVMDKNVNTLSKKQKTDKSIRKQLEKEYMSYTRSEMREHYGIIYSTIFWWVIEAAVRWAVSVILDEVFGPEDKELKNR